MIKLICDFRQFSAKNGGTNVVIYFLFSPIYFRQFSAIFANFRQKNWRNQCCDLFSIFANLFSPIFGDFRQFSAKKLAEPML
jgi:hypothetical protein